MSRSNTRWLSALALATVLTLAGLTVQAQRLTWLGTMGGSASVAYDVSVDGQFVVGAAQNDFEFWRAFRWTRTGGLQDLGTLGGAHAKAYACSADGSVVVGESVKPDQLWRAFRWTPGAGIRELATDSGVSSVAYDISADGTRIVGAQDPWDWAVWRGDGTRQYLWGFWSVSFAYGVSPDGSTIIGTAGSPNRAYYWTSTTGHVELPLLSGGDFAQAYACSADGSVIVGTANNRWMGELRAFRWTRASGTVDLGTLYPNKDTILRSVTGNGLTAVGYAADDQGQWRAIIWTSTGGIQDLNVLYASLLTTGSRLTHAYSISANGRYIVGQGYNAETGRYEGYLLETGMTGALPSIRGRISVDGFQGDLTKLPVVVELRRNQTVLRTETVYPDANGNYRIPAVTSGTYDLTFRAGGTLRAMVRGVRVGSTDVTGVNVTLLNGDLDGDNEVTVFDFGILVRSFGAVGDD